VRMGSHMETVAEFVDVGGMVSAQNPHGSPTKAGTTEKVEIARMERKAELVHNTIWNPLLVCSSSSSDRCG